MYEEVGIIFPAFKGTLNVFLDKRSRKSFREALAALGPNATASVHGVGEIPDDKIDEVRTIIAREYPDWRIATSDYRPVRQDPKDALAWAPCPAGWTQEDQHTGYAGRHPLFAIVRNYSADRSGCYGVTTTLPIGEGRQQACGRADTIAEGERIAERLLHKFVHDIGAKFINE